LSEIGKEFTKEFLKEVFKEVGKKNTNKSKCSNLKTPSRKKDLNLPP